MTASLLQENRRTFVYAGAVLHGDALSGPFAARAQTPIRNCVLWRYFISLPFEAMMAKSEKLDPFFVCGLQLTVKPPLRWLAWGCCRPYEWHPSKPWHIHSLPD